MFAYTEDMILAAIVALVVTVLLVPLVERWGRARGFVDQPGGRHAHRKPTVRIGGLALAGGFLAGMIALAIADPGKLHFVEEKILGLDRNLFGLLLGGAAIVLVGLLDDRYKLPAWLKLLLQLGAAVTIPLFGIQIFQFSNPWGSAWQLGAVSGLATVVWILLVTNTFNYLDGIDGLSSTIALITCGVITLIAAQTHVNQPATAALALVLGGAVLGFLPRNFPPARIFLGDVGAQFLGFMLAVFALISGAKVATVFLALGIPILDVVWVSARRIFTGKSPFAADRLHLHHRLLDIGLTERQAVLLLAFLSTVFGLAAVLNGAQGKFEAGLWLLVVMALLGGTVVMLQARRR